MRQLTAQWFFINSQQPNKDILSTRGHLTHPRKQPRDKQIDELSAIIHTCMACSLMYIAIVSSGETCALKWCMYKTPSCKSGHIIMMI